MKVRETLFAAIDFESAGSAPGMTDEPVQVAVAHLVGTEISFGMASYLKPRRGVTWAARAVHGITDDQLIRAPVLADLWPDLNRNLRGRMVVAHGAATEKRFLREFPLHGFGPWVDSLVLVRAVYPDLKSHALGDAVVSLGLDREAEIAQPNFRWHDAYCDSVASLVLLRHVITKCSLDDQPVEIFRSANLRRYFDLRGRSGRK